MEMLEEQQREEMELAALQEAQEYQQVRKQPNICSEPPNEQVKDKVSNFLLCHLAHNNQ